VPSALCRNGLLLLAIVIAECAVAQAPVEDRQRRADPYTEAQQRVEFSRQGAERAARRLKDAEQGLKDAEAELGPAQRRYEESKSRVEKARADLVQARAAETESRKSYETESAAFHRLRGRGNDTKESK
jgi:septal ring factor EnvC (AmiA/AmiB activator)